MKQCRTRSLRGSIQPTDGKIKMQLILSDGLINHGLKIKSFSMWASTGEPTAGIDAVLSLDVVPVTNNLMDASNSRQIAWVTGGYDNGIQTMDFREFIDPDHVVNRDLFIQANATDGVLWNYLIIADTYELSDDEAIVQIIKETQQSVGKD